jgi:hypothetical protein
MTIPEKEYNEMTGKMESTSLPQWQEYYRAKQLFEEQMLERRPKREQFFVESEYDRALYCWTLSFSMDAPNKPGYFRANND